MQIEDKENTLIKKIEDFDAFNNMKANEYDKRHETLTKENKKLLASLKEKEKDL